MCGVYYFFIRIIASSFFFLQEHVNKEQKWNTSMYKRTTFSQSKEQREVTRHHFFRIHLLTPNNYPINIVIKFKGEYSYAA